MKHPVISKILIATGFILLAEGLLFGFLVVKRKTDSRPMLQAKLNNAVAPQTEEAEEAPEATDAASATMQVAEPVEDALVSGKLDYEPPEPESFVLTMVGDCTLATDAMSYGGEGTFVGVVGDDYDYPFAAVRDLFEADDFTIVNLECNLTDVATVSDKMFAFRGPTAYTDILTGSSVEFVSYANNHMYDYGYEGYDETIAALEDAGLPYCERNSTALYTTESGLTIGVYAGYFTFDEADMVADIGALREQGADVVIASLHWGDEGKYHQLESQEYYGHVAIDAGADIVYGHHPHVLQPVETYGDGIIFYSLGNFSFGGNTNPRDKDTVIVQQEIIREGNEVRLGETTLIPCCVSSAADCNTYQPTPYEAGTEEYDRVLSKLDGTFDGKDLTIDYSAMGG